MQPRDEALDPVLADRQLGERPAEYHGYAVSRVALELRAQVGAHDRRPPAELYDIDARARDLQKTLHLRNRQSAVDHMRQPPPTGLARTLGYVQEAHGTAVVAVPEDSPLPPADDARSAPTTTTTAAVPASDAADDSSGCKCVTPRDRATAWASA